MHSVQDIARWVTDHHAGPPIALFLEDVEAARSEGLYDLVRKPFVDNSFVWVVMDGPLLPVSRFEQHPNEQTHVQYAEALLKVIVETNIIDERSVSGIMRTQATDDRIRGQSAFRLSSLCRYERQHSLL